MVLMVTMIVGVITVVWLLVTRMPDGNAAPVLPAAITLPDGLRAVAVTMGKGWTAVVTTDQQILIFDVNGQLGQQFRIDVAPTP